MILKFYFPPHSQRGRYAGGTYPPASFAPELHPVRAAGTARERQNKKHQEEKYPEEALAGAGSIMLLWQFFPVPFR